MRDREKEARARLKELKRNWMEAKRDKDVEVDADDIAAVVSVMTGIPVVRLEEEESAKLLKMEEGLAQRVVGQEEAVSAVARAVRRNRVGLRDPKRPIGSFMFLGPTGVGKTELARAPATWVTTRAASTRRRCAANPTASCSLTRSRRRTPTCSTFCCRCWTTAC
jgi:ATP-dependent Clp protease ATP-binding subunit ClpC